jgi:hypothetical protein
VAGRLVVDRNRLSLSDDHAAGVAVDAVVVRRRDVPEVLVALLVAGSQGRRETVALAAFPEILLEGFPLIGSRQLEEEVLFFREDDRADVIGQPAALVLGESLDLVRFLFLGEGRRCLGQRGPGESEECRDEERNASLRRHQP